MSNSIAIISARRMDHPHEDWTVTYKAIKDLIIDDCKTSGILTTYYNRARATGHPDAEAESILECCIKIHEARAANPSITWAELRDTFMAQVSIKKLSAQYLYFKKFGFGILEEGGREKITYKCDACAKVVMEVYRLKGQDLCQDCFNPPLAADKLENHAGRESSLSWAI